MDAGDDWFEPITYDATAYEDLDAYLNREPGSGQPQPSWRDRPLPDDTWPPRTPGASRRRSFGQARTPGWLLPAVAAVAAAALGFGFVVLTGQANGSLPSSAMPSSAGAPGPGSTTGMAAGPGLTPPSSVMSATPGMTSGSPAGSQAPTGMTVPITEAQAERVLAGYTVVNNTANAQASDSLIAGAETGSSVAIDSGIYQAQRASEGTGYPAFGPVSAAYYIPLESPASYPHWFAVQVRNALLSDPGKIINAEYLIFTQATPGATWLDASEPFIQPDSAPLPAIALDAAGFATVVTANDPGLLLSPGAASAATATALDSGAGQPASPGNLADEQDLASLRDHIPSRSGLTDTHVAASFPLFGLRTTGGGALLFYTVAARLTVTAPQGSTLSLDVPGFTSPGQQVTAATLDYLEQFATYDPPRGQGTTVPVIADYSGLTAVVS